MFSKFHYNAAHFIRSSIRSSCSTNLCLKEQLPGTAYKPNLVEKDVYQRWEKEGHFAPDLQRTDQSFSMVLPPPNVTGKLHLGHALGCTIQDVILRRQRSMGKNVLWVPGTDHAGIATQTVVEKYLKNTKHILHRHYLGREHFIKEVWRWKKLHGDTITKQLRNLGCSLDWSREIFTMDPERSKAVNEAFIQLFSKGLIYRKKAIVNWCTALNSTVSDIEVENMEINEVTELQLPNCLLPVKFGQIYSFAYKIFGSNDEIIVSTTKPETMLGDTAVAVHPKDGRYIHLAGSRLHHPFKPGTIPLIFDEFVDKDFGTGAVKITPAHSKIDYEVAMRHLLPIQQVIDESGRMIDAGEFTNLDRYECRNRILDTLAEMGFLREVKPHKMTLPICSRTGDVIEYLPKEQWFISCKSMNSKAKLAVVRGELKIEPEKYEKNWFNWTNDDRDWCISRQLWWGHRVPAFKCSIIGNSCKTMWVAASEEDEAKVKAARMLNTFPQYVLAVRDDDVLDTWFSSGIYPFACLGWPHKTSSLQTFYPLSLMATGHDILGLWVHRMVMLGLELTDQLPFNKVLLHGIICDNKGAKMSKSKGNVIDPVDVIEGISMEKLKAKTEEMRRTGALSQDELNKALAYHKANFSHTNGIPECGVDALRFTLLSQDVKSHFVNFDVSMCHANKLFCNKIWQSIKYTQTSCARLPMFIDEIKRNDLTYFDKWILSRLANMVQKVNKYLDAYDFHLATRLIRNHIYNEFCDTYLEATKAGFADNNNVRVKYAHAHTLTACLNTSLRCLNPFMVYLTEAAIPTIPKFENNIIVNYDDEKKKFFEFPQYEDFESWKDPELEVRVEKFLKAASTVRELKGLCGMSSKLRPSLCIKTNDNTLKQDLTNNLPIILNLARCCTLDFARADNTRFVRGLMDEESEVWVETLGTSVENTVHANKEKLRQKIIKLERNINNMKKHSSKKHLRNKPKNSRAVERELELREKELLQIKADLERLKDDYTIKA